MKRKLLPIILVIILIFSLIPVNAFADPISAAVISNAFAQAITAYGASNGISLTFDGVDSSNVSNIGQNMHDLWVKFREGQQTADDWDTLTAAIFPGLYSKVVNTAGTALVAINIADTYMPDVDAFWNWLLSGPAEMQKVDNSFQWNVVDGNVVFPKVLDHSEYSFGTIPVYKVPASFNLSGDNNQPYYYTHAAILGCSIGSVYCFAQSSNFYNGTSFYILAPSIPSDTTVSFSKTRPQDGTTYGVKTVLGITSFSNGWQYAIIPDSGGTRTQPTDKAYISGSIPDVSSNTDVTVESEDSITVRPYVGDTVAKPVPIPDTSDPDYGPLPYIGNLPIPWNDTLFGDGTGTLSDTQSKAIADAIDDSIVDSEDKTLEIVREQTLPDNPTLPNEVYIPFLPVSLPEFNFSLSGIWHYVREWVNSLGSWFSLVFTVWSNLPYALVVPVYASAVIVIVLGVYKRFFM